jgi:hypothetical protein
MDMDSHQTQGNTQPTATVTYNNSVTVVYIDDGPPLEFNDHCTRWDPWVEKKCRCKWCQEYDAEHNAYLRSFWELVDTLKPHQQRMLRQVDSNQYRILKEPLPLPAPACGAGLPATG